MKKILFLITGLKPGGAELMLEKIINNVDQSLIEPVICTLTPDGEIKYKLINKGFKVYDLSVTSPLHLFKAIYKVRKIVTRETPSIIHCFMWHSNIIGRIATIGLKVKVISSVRVKLINRTIWNYIDYFTQKLVNIYMVNSKSVKKFIIQNKINKNKIRFVQNGLEFNKLNVVKKNIREELSIMNNHPIISMVANLREQKDYPTMIAALAKVKSPFNFLAIGSGTEFEDEKERIKKCVKQFNLKNIHFLGHRKDVFTILKETDLWVSSTLYEGQSNALLEAMAFGLPIITTNIPENAEVVTNNKEALLIDVKNPQATADAIDLLLINKQLAIQLGNNAKLKSKDYDIKTVIKKLNKLYDEVLQ